MSQVSEGMPMVMAGFKDHPLQVPLTNPPEHISLMRWPFSLRPQLDTFWSAI